MNYAKYDILSINRSH